MAGLRMIPSAFNRPPDAMAAIPYPVPCNHGTRWKLNMTPSISRTTWTVSILYILSFVLSMHGQHMFHESPNEAQVICFSKWAYCLPQIQWGWKQWLVFTHPKQKSSETPTNTHPKYGLNTINQSFETLSRWWYDVYSKENMYISSKDTSSGFSDVWTVGFSYEVGNLKTY